MGVDLGGWSFGAQFADLNNDGFLDLYVVNGYVSASKTDSYWYDYSKVAGGNQMVISDARNWPAMGDRRRGKQKKVGSAKPEGSSWSRADGRRSDRLRYDGRFGRGGRSGEQGRVRRAGANQAAAESLETSGCPVARAGSTSISKAGRGDGRGYRLQNPSAIGARVRVLEGSEQVQEVSGGWASAAEPGRCTRFGVGEPGGQGVGAGPTAEPGAHKPATTGPQEGRAGMTVDTNAGTAVKRRASPFAASISLPCAGADT